MATYTPNYQLHQWEATDDFLRTDFNEDFAKIDAAIRGVETDTEEKLAEKAETVRGAFTGNGSTLSINLGFRPTAVIISGGDYLHFNPRTAIDGDAGDFTITNTGFQVQEDVLNDSGRAYRYLALH